jgi:2-oxoglutarate ferredoxin oxidoreductase subunit beta
MHDGSILQLHKLSQNWDPQNRVSAMNAIKSATQKQEILTGLLYIDTDTKDLHSIINTAHMPLNTMSKDRLCPGSEALRGVNDGLR